MVFSPINRRKLLIGAAALATPTLLAACNSSAPVDAEGRIRLRLAAPGPARADHGGFYQAIATGLYAKRNLNVQLFHGNSSDDVSRHLASGTAELGLAQDSFSTLRMVNEPAPVKAVAAFFQKDPRVIIARANGPRTLADIDDRAIYFEDADWPDFWAWLRTQYNLQTEQLIRPETGALAPFIDDDNSLLIGSLTREPALVSTTAPELRTRLLLAADNGYASYANLLMTTNGFARDNGDALKNFISASIEGWEDYLKGDGEEAHALIRRANPATPQGSLDAARDLIKEYKVVTGDGADQIGSMTKDRWQAFAEQATQAFNSQPDWVSAFETQFLPDTPKVLGSS